VEAGELDLIDFDRVCIIRRPPGIQFEEFIKQKIMMAEECEIWIHVSERIAEQFGMPRWSVFRLDQVDGAVAKIGSKDNDDAYIFEWITGRQYWWQNEHDQAMDLRNGTGKQIKLRGPAHMEDTMAIDRGWNPEEIAGHFRNLFNVPNWQRVVIQGINESEYIWWLEDESVRSPENLVEYRLILGSRTFNMHSGEGSNEFLGEWISRGADVKLLPLGLCQITKNSSGSRVRIRNSKEPVPILEWRGEINEHEMVFHIEGREVTTGFAQRWRYPYDRAVIMDHGSRLDNAIPLDPNEAAFPDEPWPVRVDIQIRSGGTQSVISSSAPDDSDDSIDPPDPLDPDSPPPPCSKARGSEECETRSIID
jgi:hypothetical protein